jgi:hypothetical protein
MDRNYVIIGLLAAAVICAGGWVHDRRELRAVGAEVADTLGPVAQMLQENARLTAELQRPPYAEGETQFVSAYLIKIRRDGVPQHSDMKQRIDRIVNNDTAILALLAKYSAPDRTAEFQAAAERFREYAISLRDRWQSIPEIFMAGGNLPVAGPPNPIEFVAVVNSERSVANRWL